MLYRRAMIAMKTAIVCHWKRPTCFLTVLVICSIFILHTSSNLHMSADFFMNNVQPINPVSQPHSNSGKRLPTTTSMPRVYQIAFKDVSYTFNFLFEPVQGVCVKEPNYEVVVFVTSAAEEFAQREAIRNSWAEKAADMGALVLFVVGFVPELITNLTTEYDQNNDMIVTSIREHYRNLTLKVLSALTWKNDRCSNVKFIFKTDSDVVVNTQELVKYCVARKDKSNNIFGHVWSKVKPNRNKSHRWYTSNESYPNTFWPPYTSGPGYLMTADVPARLLNSSVHHNFIAIEDSFITGVLANHSAVKRTHDSTSFRWWKWKRYDACNPKDEHVISAHGFNTPNAMKQAWTQISTAKCTQPRWQDYGDPRDARRRMMREEGNMRHRRPPGWPMRRPMPPGWDRRSPGGRRRGDEEEYGPPEGDEEAEGSRPPRWQRHGAQRFS